MRSMSWLQLLVVGIAACGGGDNSGTCPIDVKFVPDGTPTFLAARDVTNGSNGSSGSAWQLPTLDSDGTYHICVATAVEIVEVCEHPDGSFTGDEFLALASEVSEVAGASCNAAVGSGSAVATVTLSGSVSQPGIVAADTVFAVGATSPWDYSLAVVPGTYDVIASTGVNASDAGSGSGSAGSGSDAGLLAISRGVSVGSDATLDIDMATGVALEPVAITLDNAGSDALTLATETVYATETSETTIAVTHDATLLIAPSTAVAPNEAQAVEIVATDGSGRQQTLSGSFGATTGSAAFQMLGPLDGVSFGSSEPEAVTWAVLPGYSDLQVELVTGGGVGGSGSAGDPVSILRVTASTSWQQQFAVTTLGFDTSAPGYQTTWDIDPSAPHGRELEVELDSVAVTLTSAVISIVGAPSAVVPSWRGAARASGVGDRGIRSSDDAAGGRAPRRRP